MHSCQGIKSTLNRLGVQVVHENQPGATPGVVVVTTAGDVHFTGANATVDVDSLFIGLIVPVIADVEFDAAVNVRGDVDINSSTVTLDAAMNTGGGVTVSNTALADLNAPITSVGPVYFDSIGPIDALSVAGRPGIGL